MLGEFTSNVSNEDHQVSGSSSFVSATYLLFIVLATLSLGLHHLVNRTKAYQTSGNNEHFLRFQRIYFVAYFLALFGDWLQGPYVYKLYSHYGFVESQIASLYVVGFAASVFFGTTTGAMADKFGRKKMCILFCFLYSICCVTKLSPNYHVLMLGRLLGGISTSLLFSTFESWYIHEHIQTYDFPQEWISVTFTKATFWNSVLAIFAGIIANFTSEWLNFGPVSPFLMAIPFLLFCGLVVSRAWKENYGSVSQKGIPFVEGLRVILSSEKIFLLGIVQSLFESVMYIFVFLWTPILDPASPPLGIVFSVFMICITIGSSSYRLLCARHIQSEKILFLANVIAVISMCGCAYSTRPERPNILLSFGAFILLEFAIGMYFPAIAFIKSQLIPETYRANIMNWFRVPLNVITCIALLWLHSEDSKNGNHMIFVLCAVMMIVASTIMWRLNRIIATSVGLPQKFDGFS